MGAYHGAYYVKYGNCTYIIACTPIQKSTGGQRESPQHTSDVSDGAAVPEADLEYDPPTDMESDVSMLEEGPSTSHSAPKHNYVSEQHVKNTTMYVSNM